MSKLPQARRVPINTYRDAYANRRWEITADYYDEISSVTITAHVTNPDGSPHRHDKLSLYWADISRICEHGTASAAETRHCATHTDQQAAAVLIHSTDPPHIGAAVCAECATCQNCKKPAEIMDIAYEEFYCRHCADQYRGEEAVTGPAVVAIDSDTYRQLTGLTS